MRAHKNIPCFIIVLTLLFVTSSFNISNAELTNSGLFLPYVNFPTGLEADDVAIGDVNGDGQNDVVITTSYDLIQNNDYRLFVFLQNKYGLFESPIKYLTSGKFNNARATATIGDINNDGRNDVIIGNLGLNIEVFLQNGSGGLDASVKYPIVDLSKIRIGDFNNNGLLDIAGIGCDTNGGSKNSVSILTQTNEGRLNSPVVYTIAGPGINCNEFEIGDINNDGLTDIIVARAGEEGSIGILLQQSGGIFGVPVFYDLPVNIMSSIGGIATGDLNSDGLQDIVVTRGGNQPTSEIVIFYQNDKGTLDSPTTFSSYDIPESVKIADVNQDGKLDVVVEHSAWGVVGIYLQNDGGISLPELFYYVPISSNGIAVGDINSDGANDVAIADYNYGLIVLYDSKSPAVPDISVYPEFVSFGSVFLNNTPIEIITVYNKGTGSLTINSITIDGDYANNFSFKSDCQKVETGSTCTIDVTFTAKPEGIKYANLNIYSNDPDVPTNSLQLIAYAGLKQVNLFKPYVSLEIGFKPDAVAIGDVTGDGMNDVVMTTTHNDYNVLVFPQNKNGGLDSHVQYKTSGKLGNESGTIAIGDINNDGRNDIVVGNSELNIEVFLQNEYGLLNPSVKYPTTNSTKIRVGDFNNDGLLDVAGVGPATNSVDIFLQNNNGTLNTAVSYPMNHGQSSRLDMDIGDINNDELTDIVVVYSNSVGIILQQPDGTLSLPIYYSLYRDFDYIEGVAVGDVNGDTLQDVVVSYGGNFPSARVGIFYQNTSGTLEQPVSYYSYNLYQLPLAIEIADMNQDGRNDIVVGQAGQFSVGVYLQSTVGILMPEDSYTILYDGHNPQGLDVGDINEDGINDIVAVNFNQGLKILYGINIDIDGDGYTVGIDCNDDNPLINPGTIEILNNGVDDDCNPATPAASVSGGGYSISKVSKPKAAMSLNVDASSLETSWLKYSYPPKEINFKSTSITDIAVSGGVATITGTGKIKKIRGYTFKAVVAKGIPDKISIEIYKPNGKLYYRKSLQSVIKGNYSIVGQ